MKRILITTIAAFAVLAFSCKKDNQSHVLFIGATLKNTSWLAQPSTSYLANRDSLQVTGIKETMVGSQNLSFKIRFRGIGTYALTAGEATFVNFFEAASMSYKLDITQPNLVNITSFDVKTNIAAGSFQLYFTNATGNPGKDNLSFTNGSFWIQTQAVPGQ